MQITTTQTNGKHYARVADGDRIAYVSPGYHTAGMAQSAAKCWIAFHGKGSEMGKIVVDLNEVYTSRGAGRSGLEYMNVPAGRVARRVASAYEYGQTVEIRTSMLGTPYIQISDGKGSSYAQFHIGPVFAHYAHNKRWNESA
jgi:hypothetical protein